MRYYIFTFWRHSYSYWFSRLFIIKFTNFSLKIVCKIHSQKKALKVKIHQTQAWKMRIYLLKFYSRPSLLFESIWKMRNIWIKINKIFESKNIYTVMCNTVFSIAKEGSKSCLCAGSSRARGSKAVRRGAVPPPPCRRSRVIASTWQLELPSLCTLAAVATVAAATPNYFALVAMSRRHSGAGGGGGTAAR